MSELIAIQPNRNIGGLYADVTVEEESVDRTEITRHPVERGATTSDHAFNIPAEVTITAGVSNSSFAALTNFGITYAIDFYNELLKLKTSLKLFSVTTGKRHYDNMLCEVLAITTTVETEESLMFRATFRELNIAQTQTTSVPPTENQQLPQQTGATQTTGSQQLTPATTFNSSDAYMNG